MNRQIPSSELAMGTLPAHELLTSGQGRYVELPYHPLATIHDARAYGQEVSLTVYTFGRGYCSHVVPLNSDVRVSVAGSLVPARALMRGDIITNAPGFPGRHEVLQVSLSPTDRTAALTVKDVHTGETASLGYRDSVCFILANR